MEKEIQLNEYNKQEYPPMDTNEMHYVIYRQKNIRTKGVDDGNRGTY